MTDQDAQRLRRWVGRRGSLPINEVTACLLGSVAEAITAELREIFTLAAADGSGRLGREELALLLEILEETHGPSAGRRRQLQGDGGPADALDYEAFLRLVLHDDGVVPSLGDLHSPFTTPSGNMHGMPLAIASGHDNLGHAIHTPDARILELWAGCQALAGGGRPAIELRDLVYVSVRATEPAEDAVIAEHGIPVIRTEDVRSLGPEQAAVRALEHLAEADLIDVSFDVDSLDATICKGTGTPAPGGLWPEEAQELHRVLLRDPRVCCWEICEINPHLDTLNTMAELSLGIYRTVLEVLEERLGGQE